MYTVTQRFGVTTNDFTIRATYKIRVREKSLPRKQNIIELVF